jgi:hypothetical protein
MKPSRNLWPLGITLLLVLFGCGITTLVVIAASSNTELVSEKYYEHEIQYQQQIDALKRAREAGASLAYDAAARRILVSLGRVAVTPDAPARVELYRPSAKDLDQVLPLLPAPGGTPSVDAGNLQPGPWNVRASWSVGGQEFLLEGRLTNTVGMATNVSHH